jgi:cobalamin synthase
LNLALGLGLGSFLALALPSVFWGLCSPMDAAKALGVGLLGLGLGRFLLRIPMGRLGGISGDLLGWSQVITEISVAFGLTLALVK